MERPGANQVQGWRHVRAGCSQGQEEGTASERKGLQGVEGREIPCAYGLSGHLMSGVRGCLRKAPSAQVTFAEGEWSNRRNSGHCWRSSACGPGPSLLLSRYWQPSVGKEATADPFEGQLAVQVGLERACHGLDQLCAAPPPGRSRC